MEKELRERLKAYKEGLSDQEIEKLVSDTAALVNYQEEESAPEDLAKIPVLKREDITREIAPIYNEERKAGEVPLVHHKVETNGIGYVTLMFDLSEVEEELLTVCRDSAECTWYY